LEGIIRLDDDFDVLVCNPPFFKSRADAEQKNKRKANNLKLKENVSLNFGGRSNELWYKGGEAAFVKKMAEESVQFKDQIHWFTSLVSKKENLGKIKHAIEHINPKELNVVDMAQGHKKSRFVAWRF